MRPIQLWLPTLNASLSRADAERDARRAMKEWRGEAVIWLLPELKKSVQWFEGKPGSLGYSVLALPSEQLERLEIYHVGENGRVWGPKPNIFPRSGVGGLLNQWLKIEKIPGTVTPEPFTLQVPRIKKGTIVYQVKRIRLKPFPSIPFYKVNKKSRSVICKWPPDGKATTVISPEAEIAEHYGKHPETQVLHVVLRWPKPFSELLPLGGGFDVLFARDQMSAVAKASAEHLEEILRYAKEAATRYLSQGYSTPEHSWFWPALVQSGNVGNVLDTAQAKFGIDAAKPMNRLWRERMLKMEPMQRAYGVIGLMWVLLLDRLENGKRFWECKRCGRIIAGKKGKEFCGREDNKDCFKKRRAADKRRERSAD